MHTTSNEAAGAKRAALPTSQEGRQDAAWDAYSMHLRLCIIGASPHWLGGVTSRVSPGLHASPLRNGKVGASRAFTVCRHSTGSGMNSNRLVAADALHGDF